MSENCVKEIQSGSTTFFLLAQKTNDSSYMLFASNCQKAWRGKVIIDKNLAETLNMSIDDHAKDTEKALTSNCNDEFSYEIQSKQNNLMFIWKKDLAKAGIKFQLGSCILTPEKEVSPVITKILRCSLEKSLSLQKSIQHLTGENDRLKHERGLALKKYEKLVSVKEDVEKDLYAKFAVVLNSKKQKIRDLKEKLTLEPQPGPSVTNVTKDENDESENDLESDKLSDYNYDTEEESTAVNKKTFNRKKPNVSKTLDQDNSLILDLDADEGSAPVSKRRRQNAAEKAKTLAKPVIPKTKSAEKRTTRKVGRKSTGSSQEAEVLMDQL